MQKLARQLTTVLCLAILAACNASAETPLQLPRNIATHDDGRAPIQDIYSAYATLVEHGWRLDIIAESRPEGTNYPLPIIALRSPEPGPAAWFITGIHGEEPAGPNALAHSVDALAELGERHAVIIVPLANPHGYVRNWRYLNVAIYDENIEGQSVGDSSYRLLGPEGKGPLVASAPNPEADALTRYVLERSRDYPPRYSIDLHEDNLIHAGYVYSQGEQGADDPLATEAINILRDNDIAIQTGGQTRFEEDIVDGIIGPVTDSSIDELMSVNEAWLDGEKIAGPAAHTVLVFETPAAHLDIAQRVEAHETLLRRLAHLIKLQSTRK
jgi:hypothetical protein